MASTSTSNIRMTTTMTTTATTTATTKMKTTGTRTTATANKRGVTSTTTKKKKKKSSLNIKIKPFVKPPSLPPNFYKTSTDVLYSSLHDILHLSTSSTSTHMSTSASTSTSTSRSASGKFVSREELYQKVTDLCSHGYGPQLYLELVDILDHAAFVCVSRLVEHSNNGDSGNGNGIGDGGDVNMDINMGVIKNESLYQGRGGGDKIHYPTPHCRGDWSGNSEVYFTYCQDIDVELKNGITGTMPMPMSLSLPSTNSVGGGGTGASSIISNEDHILLGNIWTAYSDFVQYLDRVLKIFQSLDRMFVYSPPTIRHQEEEAKVFPRNGGISMGGGSASTGSGSARASGGKENITASNASGGIAIGAWNMWDVGINCIYRHMGHVKKEINKSLSSGSSSGDAVMEDCGSIAATSTSTTVGTSNRESKGIASANATAGAATETGTRYSPLYVLKQRTIACLIEELKMTSSRPSSSPLTLLRPMPSSQTQSHSHFHQPTLRNCVSIIRSFTHVAAHRSNAYVNEQKKDVKIDLMGDFLGALVSAVTSFLMKESQSFMLLDDATPSNLNIGLLHVPGKTSYDVRATLHHVDVRLKQMSSMTTYYTLSTSSSSTYNDSRTKAISSDTTMMGSRNDNRTLSHLVEVHLLTPHFSTQHILNPVNLYPILDDDGDGSSVNVKLLFQLSKRVHSSNDVSSLQEKNFSAITFSPGMELLRKSFEMYGKERGLSIMRPNMSPNNTSTPSTIGEAVKPPPPMTSREVQNKIVSNLLGFKSHLEFLHKEAFGGDTYFGKTLRKILEDVLNQGGEIKSSQNQSVLSTSDRRKKSSSFRHSGDGCDGGKRIAELLAKYIDQRFKNAKLSLSASPMKSARGSTSRENEMDAFQNAALDLFRHIQSKDVFEAFYRRDLAKRLLLNKSASIDAERAFVSKLKAECGTGYTSKMEGMFKDMELSRDVMANYSSYLGSLEDVSSGKYKNISGAGVDMDVQVLTTGYWPLQTQHPSLILPESLTARRDHFESHYLSKYQGRRIGWQNSLGNCIVKARFPKMTEARELNVSLCQALVLMCFNVEEGAEEDPKFTIGDIMKKTGLGDRGETERVLQSLSMGREGTQVLRRIDEKSTNKYLDGTSTAPKKKHKMMRKAISDSDVFVFNSNFFNNQRRIRITNIQMKETAEERTKTQEAVSMDRLHLIDAAIVRTMKARKTLDHSSLVAEVMRQLKFPAPHTDIKKRIETLIEREYLERTEGDSSRYNYLA